MFRRVLVAAAVALPLIVTAPAGAQSLPPVCHTKPWLEICQNGDPDPDPTPTPTPPPPPPTSPANALELVRQTTDRSGVHIVGWTADPDAPTTPLTVRFTVNGVLVGTMTADKQRPDVAAAHPNFGPAHGYDATLTAAPTAQICVTAANVGAGSNATRCGQLDRVKEFVGNSISYDVAHARLINSDLESLDRVTNTNATQVQQSTTISGTRTVTETFAWASATTLKISAKGKVGIPILAEGEITVEGSETFTVGETTARTRTFSWQQPVLVPPMSRVVASVSVTRSQLSVPYSLVGNYVYESGAEVAGSVFGDFAGINSHDLEVRLEQFDLNGVPAPHPVAQPRPTYLRST